MVLLLIHIQLSNKIRSLPNKFCTHVASLPLASRANKVCSHVHHRQKIPVMSYSVDLGTAFRAAQHMKSIKIMFSFQWQPLGYCAR